MLAWMSKILISKEQLERNQIPIFIVVLVLGVCRELSSPHYSLGLRSSEAYRCSLQGRNPGFCVLDQHPLLLHGDEKVERMSHALHLREVMAIVTSSACSSSGPTIASPASGQNQRYSRALLQGYAKCLSFIKLLTWESRLPGLARLRSPARRG